MVAADKRGLDRKLSATTIYLLNRQAIADRWHCTPVDVENWPAYEQDVALQLLQIEAAAEKRKPKPKPRK